MHVYISDLKNYIDKEVTVKGWVSNIRSSGKIMFLEVRDGSGFVQAIIDMAKVSQKVWDSVTKATLETSIIIEGVATRHPRKPQELELHVQNAEIVSIAQDYPLGRKEHGPDFLLDKRHLWIRTKRQRAILKVRSELVFAMQEFMRSRGFVLTHTPTFTPNACEGTTDLFEVQYFDKKAYLTQNGQLYLEALAMALGRVYDINPNFRAEKSKTRKHLTEFWSMNPEAIFFEHEDSIAFQEDLVSHLIGTALERCAPELNVLERDVSKLKGASLGGFPRFTYNEAIKKLQEKGAKVKYGDDFGADEEVLLTEDQDRPIFIEKWPKAMKPFYTKGDPKNPELVLCSDMLAPEGYGEIIGGSQREDDYETLKANISAHKLSLNVFEWYLDLRKFGSVPHSGFGLGIERFVAWITGTHHVRETTAFPRMLNRIEP